MIKASTINGYDFHCHVDLHPSPLELIRRCEMERIAVLAVTTTPLAWSQNQEWTKYSTLVHAAVGLHPELVGDRYNEVELLEKCIGQSRFVGEVGLDGSPQHRGSYDLQKDVFIRTLRAANTHGGRVLTIHSRHAAADVISLIRENTRIDKVKCILHWFSGSVTDLHKATSIGCYFSINQPMVQSDRGRALLKAIPLERLLTETDAPFVKINGKPSDPVRTKDLLLELSKLRSISIGDLHAQIDENSKRVFAAAGVKLD